MKIRDKTKTISEEEIDEIVERHADDDSAWEEPIHVHWTKLSLASLPFPVSLPSKLVERAAFFAELYGGPDTEAWLMRVIQERVDFEMAVLVHLEEYTRVSSTVSLPAGFAERVDFFAEQHRQPSAGVWVTRVIQERIESEEAAFKKLKSELTAKK